MGTELETNLGEWPMQGGTPRSLVQWPATQVREGE